MKKVLYSFAVIAVTVFTIYILISADNNRAANIANEKGNSQEINDGREKNEQDLTDEYREYRLSDEEIEANRNKKNNINEREKTNTIDKEKVQSKEKNNDKVQDKQEARNAEILKVPAKEIREKLSIEEKFRLLTLASRLSPDDYNSIINYLKSSDASYAIKNTFKVLEKNLSDDEINEIKEMLSDYINFESV